MKVQEISLLEILRRKLEYIETSDVYKDNDFLHVKKGEVKAYKEILADIETLDEKGFIDKYLRIVVELNEKIEKLAYGVNVNTEKIEQITGYNNAIVSILMLLNPKYEFELE